jgi:hypothetical protein
MASALWRVAPLNAFNGYGLLNDPTRDEELWTALAFAHTLVAAEFGLETTVKCLDWQTELILAEARDKGRIS